MFRAIYYYFVLFNDTLSSEFYTLSLHDALPICGAGRADLDSRIEPLWRTARGLSRPALRLCLTLRAGDDDAGHSNLSGTLSPLSAACHPVSHARADRGGCGIGRRRSLPVLVITAIHAQQPDGAAEPRAPTRAGFRSAARSLCAGHPGGRIRLRDCRRARDRPVRFGGHDPANRRRRADGDSQHFRSWQAEAVVRNRLRSAPHVGTVQAPIRRRPCSTSWREAGPITDVISRGVPPV